MFFLLLKHKWYTAVAILLSLLGAREAQSTETALLPSEFVTQYEYAMERSDLFASLLEAGVTGDSLGTAQMSANAAATHLQFLFNPTILGEPTAGYPLALSPLGSEKVLIANSLLGDIEYRVNVLNAVTLARASRLQIGIPLTLPIFDTQATPPITYTIENNTEHPMRAFLNGVPLSNDTIAPSRSIDATVLGNPVTIQAYAGSATFVANLSPIKLSNGLRVEEINPLTSSPYTFFKESNNTFFILEPMGTIELKDITSETVITPSSSEFIFYNNTDATIIVTVGSNSAIIESGALNPGSNTNTKTFPIADGDRITGSNFRVSLDLTVRLFTDPSRMELINNGGTSDGVFWGAPNEFYLQ